MATIKLNRNQTFDLIKIYKSYEFIWNQHHELYKRSDLKRKAWQDIANRFKCSDDDIKKKIRYLRSAYIYEKRKVEDCERGGGSYEPNLFYYKELDFLKPTITSRKVDYRDEGTCNGFDETETTDGIYCEEIDQKPFAEKFEELRKYMQLKDLTELTEPNKQNERSVEPNDHREFEIDDNSNAQECPQRRYSNNTNSNKDRRLLSPLRRKAMSISSKSDEYEQSTDMSVQNNNTNHNHSKDDSTYVPPLKLRVLPSMISQNTSSHNANHVDVSTESNDIYYHTTKVWTDKLRHLTKTQRILAEKAINDIIFHGELDMLSIDKVQKISIHLNERN